MFAPWQTLGSTLPCLNQTGESWCLTFAEGRALYLGLGFGRSVGWLDNKNFLQVCDVILIEKSWH